jgi:hypothetical protein
MIALPLIAIVSEWFDLMISGGCTHPAGAIGMFKQRARDGFGGAIARTIPAAMVFAICVSRAPNCFADEPTSLTVERVPRRAMELIQGFSTTIRSERPFGKISITDPEIVDLVLRSDKTAVLIPQRTGRTNIDFLDDHGSLIGSMDVTVVRQSAKDRIVIYNRPSLGAYSTFHCGQKSCEHFEEIPNKEEALTPNLPQDRSPLGMPPQ